MNREFEAIGTFLGQPARLKWRSGEVEGEPAAAVRAVRAVARAGAAVGIAGHFAVRASLQTRRAAMATIAYVLDASPRFALGRKPPKADSHSGSAV